jgi:transglutaminase-like putative cysteine protease
MILEIQYETRFEYSEPAAESVTEVRMEPASDADQSCHSHHLAVSPQSPTFRYQDGFGNRVHHFNLLAPHRMMRILSASIVETHPRRPDPLTSREAFPLAPDTVPLDVIDFLQFRDSVRETARLGPHVSAVRPAGATPLGRLVLSVADHIHRNFRYARDVTLATSPVDEVLEKGKGVCQDFAHLMIALLRSLGVPVRYVSGYIHRPNRESQSHAWCEAWLPDLGWIGVDPTNNRVVDE